MDSSLNQADTSWLLISTALVLLMTPGLALFYGGMVSSKNVLSTFMHSFFALGILTLQWTLFGYSLAFGKGNAFIGDFSYAFLNHVGPHGNGVMYADANGHDAYFVTTIPHILFMGFQMMFALITPALISGAFAERMKFGAFVAFTLLWSTLVYAPVAHWVWHPNGWVFVDGGFDFAGGLVVHAISGVAALIVAIVLGPRKRPGPPHNLPMTLTGAGLLWFGWFGFNAGSALASGGLASTALINTHIAAACAMVSWCFVEKLKHGKPTALGAASGLVAGLVVITPCAGFVSPQSSIAIGLIGGAICFGGVMLKSKFKYDDALDAFGVHGVGGITGAILLGLFAQTAWNPGAVSIGFSDGLLFGAHSPTLLIANLKACLVGCLYSAGVTFVILKVIEKTIGLRVDEEVEFEGCDQALHGESAYSEARGGHMETNAEA
jgi:Amt family ammonium transporter